MPHTDSDNILRRAAQQMRREVRDDEDRRFYNAVADWLEHIAKFVDNRPSEVSPATAERVWANAYHVARAYLGEA